jgi:signal transduction histidine kinase
VVSVFQALLRIAEIESGARRSAFATVDLVPVLTDLAELYEAVAEEDGKVFKLSIPAKLSTFGDRDMIQQALSNLLDNALKYSPEGAVVELHAERDPDGVKVAVIDQGVGMSDDDMKRATERFFRAEAARHSPGFGLGLTLVQAVAQLHGRDLVLSHGEAGPHGTGLVATLWLPTGDKTAQG